MAWLMRIDGVDRGDLLLAGSLETEDRINERNPLSFTLVERPDDHRLYVTRYGASAWSVAGGLVINDAALINNGTFTDLAWHVGSGGIGSTLVLNCGEPRPMVRCRMWASGTFDGSWDVECSDDATTWLLAKSGWNSGADGAFSVAVWASVGAHRYWRLRKTDVWGATGAWIYETQFDEDGPQLGETVEVLDGVELWNSASHWSVSGGITLAGTAERINNGDVGTLAFSMTAGGTVQINVLGGVTRAFRACRMYASGTYSAIWDIHYSDDGASWSICASGWNSGADGAFSTISWASVGAHQYWRLFGGGSSGQVYEVQFSTEPDMVVFNGQLSRVRREQAPGGKAVFYRCEAESWEQLATRRLLAKDYSGYTADAIVQDVVSTTLATEGIVARFIDAGPVVTKYPANWISAEAIFTELARLVGFSWYIDPDKRLHFFARETNPAPFTLTGQFLEGSLRTSLDRSRYRNAQYVQGGNGISDAVTEQFSGDGKRTTFTVKQSMASLVAVTKNGSAKTLGIRDVDTGKDWYWNEKSTEVSQDSGGTVLISTDTLAVTYTYFYQVFTAAQDDAAIAKRAILEGTTGRYESLENLSSLDGEDFVNEKTLALLREFSEFAQELSFDTFSSGFLAGQMLTTDVPAYAVSGHWLITSVRVSVTADDRLRYGVQAVRTEPHHDEADFFRRLAMAGQAPHARDNDVVRQIRQFTDTVAVDDALTITSSTFAVAVVGTAQCGFAEVGGA
jgi:hypothetical protein